MHFHGDGVSVKTSLTRMRKYRDLVLVPHKTPQVNCEGRTPTPDSGSLAPGGETVDEHQFCFYIHESDMAD